MSRPTRKNVEGIVSFTFEGNYIERDDVPNYLESWLDAALEDREDLSGWSISFGPVYEEELVDDE